MCSFLLSNYIRAPLIIRFCREAEREVAGQGARKRRIRCDSAIERNEGQRLSQPAAVGNEFLEVPIRYFLITAPAGLLAKRFGCKAVIITGLLLIASGETALHANIILKKGVAIEK